ncbi:MFS transporter, partial [Massilia arenosa]
IFWLCLAPGVLFTAGSLRLPESPRWLMRRGDAAGARVALLRTRSADDADTELADMQPASHAAAQAAGSGSLLSRRYVWPFLLACLILALTQATGINSILAYVVTILHEAGLPGAMANGADVGLKVLNMLVTVIAVVLVDRKGRKFLLSLGCCLMAVALVAAALLFGGVEGKRQDVQAALAAQVQADALTFTLDAQRLAALHPTSTGPVQLTIAYAYGDFTNVAHLRSDEAGSRTLSIRRADAVQPDSVLGRGMRALHLNPFPDPDAARFAPLRIEQAWLGGVPAESHGWLVATAICLFVAGFAIGPGVCVWLALSELMPTRIRSNGMSVALLVNQCVSTTLAAVFLPVVGRYGYAMVFAAGAVFAIVYLVAVVFLLPETRGRTLEEIEEHFSPRRPGMQNR